MSKKQPDFNDSQEDKDLLAEMMKKTEQGKGPSKEDVAQEQEFIRSIETENPKNKTEDLLDGSGDFMLGLSDENDQQTPFDTLSYPHLKIYAGENGTFEMVANDAGYTNGTGATLVVKDTKGNEVGYFTLVVFGDVNGDGLVNKKDDLAMRKHLAGLDAEINEYAADVMFDGIINKKDLLRLKQYLAGWDVTLGQ